MSEKKYEPSEKFIGTFTACSSSSCSVCTDAACSAVIEDANRLLRIYNTFLSDEGWFIEKPSYGTVLTLLNSLNKLLVSRAELKENYHKYYDLISPTLQNEMYKLFDATNLSFFYHAEHAMNSLRVQTNSPWR